MTPAAIAVAPALPDDAAELADVAARTFAMACPPDSDPADVAAFVTQSLSAARFADYLADPARTVLAARRGARIVGYAMAILAEPGDPDVARVVLARPVAELSKIYVDAAAHGSGAAAVLVDAVVAVARDAGATVLWLGVNQQNLRAQKFYAKQGFTVAGTKSFQLGSRTEDDYVMVRPL